MSHYVPWHWLLGNPPGQYLIVSDDGLLMIWHLRPYEGYDAVSKQITVSRPFGDVIILYNMCTSLTAFLTLGAVYMSRRRARMPRGFDVLPSRPANAAEPEKDAQTVDGPDQ